MPSFRPRAEFLSIIFLVGFTPALHAADGAKITQTPATVKTRHFDPKNPPRDMPPLNRDEAAVTQSKFACAVKLEVEIQQAQGQKPTAHIAGVDATLRLDVTLWLPTGG